MKTDLFEKLIRKIVREELEYYNTKLIKEIAEIKSNSIIGGQNQVVNKQKVQIGLSEGLSNFKKSLESEYEIPNDGMSFGDMQVPEELQSVFNRDYSELMKKFK